VRHILTLPKVYLAQEGNYREMRYFTGWRAGHVEQYKLVELSEECLKLQDGRMVPIGDAIISARDCTST
jgi:NAD+ synthase (glutamine-hydrolysing)